MATPNNSRASDLGEILAVGTTGFTVRKRTGVGLVIHIFLLACMILLGATLLVYYKSFEGCMLAVVIGVVFAAVSHNLEKIKKVKQSLEFMNALFSSALGKGYQFCFIVKNTGEIVFYNRPFQAVFPAYIAGSARTLDALLTTYAMPQEQRDKLNGFITANAEGSLTAPLREASAANATSYTISIEPIERPTGFFLVRGK